MEIAQRKTDEQEGRVSNNNRIHVTAMQLRSQNLKVMAHSQGLLRTCTISHDDLHR